MPSDLKRYEFRGYDLEYDITPDGDFMLYAEYEPVVKERDRLAKKLAKERRRRDFAFSIARKWKRQSDAIESIHVRLRQNYAIKVDELRKSETALAESRAENDRLRAALANSGGPCAYCSLPKEEWAKCREGFPGCPRADDAMLCPHVGASLAADAAFEDREVAICQAVEFAEYVESHAKGKMAERAEHFMKVPFAEELRLRLRAAAAYKQAVKDADGLMFGDEPGESVSSWIETRIAQLLKAGGLTNG